MNLDQTFGSPDNNLHYRGFKYFLRRCFIICILFYFIYLLFLFYFFILFYFILFYFILFYSILFYFILFYFILFYFILFYFVLFYFILFYFILFYFLVCRTDPYFFPSIYSAHAHFCAPQAELLSLNLL